MLRTREDLSDIENVRDAEHEFARAVGDARRLAAWAERWGRALIERCEELEGRNEDSATDEELNAAEARIEQVESAARTAIEKLDNVITKDVVPADVLDQYVEITGVLEASL